MLEAPELATRLDCAWRHHNGCDSSYLKLADAEYAAIAAPNGGCGHTAPNAPERTFHEPHSERDTETGDELVLYRVRDAGHAWQSGQLGCSHDLFNCGHP